MRWKTLSENYSTNMCLLRLRLIGVMDVKLAQEEQCTRMGLRVQAP